MVIWQLKITTFRRIARGWAANVVTEQNRYKKLLSDEFNYLDVESVHRKIAASER